MVKSIQLRVDDDVFEQLKDLKGDRSWEEFLVETGLQYNLVLERAKNWDNIEPYLPRLAAHLLIDWVKMAVDSMGFDEEEAEA